MKMTKNLIFQGLSTFFEIFMKSLFEVGELFAETKELTKKMPLVFSFAKTLSSAIRTLCNASAVKMDCNIDLIPFWLEFGFAFRAHVCFGYHNHIQNDKQDNYGNGYKIPRNIEMASKPIDPTGSKQKNRGEQKQRKKYFFHYNTAFLILL